MNILHGIKRYGQKRWKQQFPTVLLLIFVNLYFGVFIQEGKKLGHLLYLDFLFLVPLSCFLAADYLRFQSQERELEELLTEDLLICRNDPDLEDPRIARHDVEVLEKQLERQFKESCELQDYVAKWCHELKIPLSVGLLMTERISDVRLRQGMRLQLERMNCQMNSLLSGCRLQSPLFDLQVKRTALSQCVKTSLQNNRFFLIREGFSVEAETAGIYLLFSGMVPAVFLAAAENKGFLYRRQRVLWVNSMIFRIKKNYRTYAVVCILMLCSVTALATGFAMKGRYDAIICFENTYTFQLLSKAADLDGEARAAIEQKDEIVAASHIPVLCLDASLVEEFCCCGIFCRFRHTGGMRG